MLLNQAVLALRQSDMTRWQHLVPLPDLRQDGVVVTLEEAAVMLPPWLHHREVAETVALLAFVRGGPLVDTYGNMRRITNGRRLVWQWSLRDPDNSGAVADGSACLLVKNSNGNPFGYYLTQHYQYVYVMDYRKYFSRSLTQFVDYYDVDDVIFCLSSGQAQSAGGNSLLSGLIK